MATTTADMQQMQADTQGAGQQLSTQSQEAQMGQGIATTEDNPSQGGMLQNIGSSGFPSLNEILAQPAVKKATPAIMIGILLLFFVASYMAMQEPVYRPIFPGMNDADR